MQLTAREFAKLINDLKGDARQGERRTNPRAPTRSVVEIYHIDPKSPDAPKPQQFRVRDISRSGLGLLANQEFDAGARLIVLLPKTATETLALLCEIARIHRLPGDIYQLGTRMVRRLLPAEFAQFVANVPGIAQALADPTNNAPPLTDAA